MVEARPRAVVVAGLLLLSLFSLTVAADDSRSNATAINDGDSVSDSVDYGGGDEHDWYKISTVMGDRIEVTLSTTNGNGGSSFGDGYVTCLEITDALGVMLGSETCVDDSSTSTFKSANTVVSGNHYIHLRSEDSWFGDNSGYTVTVILGKDNRDTDEDGEIDNDDPCPDMAGTSGTDGQGNPTDRKGCPDTDGDGWSDPDVNSRAHPIGNADAFPNEVTQWRDIDGDGYGDNASGNFADICPYSSTSNVQTGRISEHDRLGCDDTDKDGWSDPEALAPAHPHGSADAFSLDPTQWNDTDDDGFGDQLEGFQGDACPTEPGNSTMDRYGCLDTDGDLWSDPTDEVHPHPVGSADAFPEEPSQWNDTDSDGWGDNYDSNHPPHRHSSDPGIGIPGALQVDDFPRLATQWRDTDGDGWGDNFDDRKYLDNRPQSWPGELIDNASLVDAFPLDPTQHVDSDGDGWGDNSSSPTGDACPSVPGKSRYDRFGCLDDDEDGYSNPDTSWPAHPDGMADAFPNEPTQWHDTDGDGYGDNQAEGASRPDACPGTEGTSSRDRLGCIDEDGDGYSNADAIWLSSPLGLADAFPNAESLSWRNTGLPEAELWILASLQWGDTDGDGWGDAPGNNLTDACPTVPGTSRLDLNGCPDFDGDGISDLTDAFDFEVTQWRDMDGDGFGDDPEGHQSDACPESRGSSLVDRLGCPDDDEDGWSNANDAFPTDRLQWSDVDGDGYGDHPIGPRRDDCPGIAGTSTLDRQGCPDPDGDGMSTAVSSFESSMLEIEDNPTASPITWSIWGLFGLLGLLIGLGNRPLNRDELLEELQQEFETSPYLASHSTDVFDPTVSVMQAQSLAYSPYAGGTGQYAAGFDAYQSVPSAQVLQDLLEGGGG